MKRETVNASLREIATVIAEQREIAKAEIALAETNENQLHWEGYDLGLAKAYRAIETHLNRFKD